MTKHQHITTVWTGPGLLSADTVYQQWKRVLTGSQQQNFIPSNPFSGYETVGAVEFVNYMLLQSDPGGFIGFFEAWSVKLTPRTPIETHLNNTSGGNQTRHIPHSPVYIYQFAGRLLIEVVPLIYYLDASLRVLTCVQS